MLAVGDEQNAALTNYGEEFFIGMMNYLFSDIRLVVAGEDDSSIQFSVEIDSGVIYSGTTTATNPVVVNLPRTQSTTSSAYTDRNKGVHIYTTGGGRVSVLAVNAALGEYLAYPCLNVSGGPYEYFAVSIGGRFNRDSEFLLVACEDDTHVTISPSQSVTLPQDAQSSTSPTISILAGSSHDILLNRMQTFLIGRAESDLTGTRIVSSKPLTVISGHECASIPEYEPFCEPLAEHIPPTTTWGKSFLLAPFGRRDVGQYYRIIASMDNTTFTVTCNNFSVSNTSTITGAGNFHEFFTSSTTYCSLISNKPVLVAQLGVGRHQDSDTSGDPIISIVPSINQYDNNYTFSTLNSSDFDINVISVTVRPEHYQPSSIHLDAHPITATWNVIYDSQHIIVGYGCHVNVSGGSIHTVRHSNPNGRLAVMVYGFSSSVGRSYGYLAGLKFTPLQFGKFLVA